MPDHPKPEQPKPANSKPEHLQDGPRAALFYKGPDPHDYALEALDGLSALFDRRSGQTHLVASPVPELLALMDETPRTINALLTELAKQFELEEGGDHAASLTARLEELAALGLVEVVR